MAAKKRAQGLTAKTMKTAINEMAAEIGMPPLRFEPDADLSAYWRGAPLKIAELRALPNGSIVWALYRKHGEEGFRMDGAMRISKQEGEADWWLEDGSSFAGEFRPDEDLGDDEDCFDSCYGEGEMRLFHTERLTLAEKKARVQAQARLTRLLEDIQRGGPAAKRAMAAFKKLGR